MFKLDAEIYSRNGVGIPLRPGFRYSNGGWEALTLRGKYDLDNGHLGADDGIGYREGGCPISVPDSIGKRGEAIYMVKTVYTDIKIDGERDPAYDYGVHLSGAVASKPEYYDGRETNIEVYMVRGQDGRLYVFGEITDPDIVIEEELRSYKAHWCDSVHCYIEPGNHGSMIYANRLILGCERYAPSGCAVKMTDKGYNFEYSFDNNTKPFVNEDLLGFAFYYNDTNEYVDSKNFKRAYVKLPSRLNPEGAEYLGAENLIHDALIFSHESATGSFVLSNDCDVEKTGDALADIISGAASVRVIYPNLCPAHTVLFAKEIGTILRYYGAEARATAESEAREADYTILVDHTSFDESRTLSDIVKYNGYALSFGEKTFALAGRMESSLRTAKDLFLSALDYVINGGRTSDLGKLYCGSFDEIANAPEMDGLSLVTDAGDGSYMLLSQNSALDAFDRYAEKLKTTGYKLYTENRMSSVRCATYVGDCAIINLTYGENEGDRSLRAVVDIPRMTALPPVEREEYTPICASSVTQLKPKAVCYMSYVIKQDNGEYFIIDAGGNGAQHYIYESLMKMSSGEDVVVSAWLFTHFHCDHIGGFIELADNAEYMKKIRVKSIILNFPQWQVLDTCSAFDHRNLARWHGIVEKTGATVYQARTGQKYYFGNVELEMLFTYEDLMPFEVYADRTNPTSHIFSMKIDGQRFIMTGDACGEATTLLVKRMGEDLKADFVQLPHHGFGDGGTDVNFYKLIDAPWVLYPGTGFRANKPEQWALDHSKAYFLNIGRDSVIPLPYSGQEV